MVCCGIHSGGGLSHENKIGHQEAIIIRCVMWTKRNQTWWDRFLLDHIQPRNIITLRIICFLRECFFIVRAARNFVIWIWTWGIQYVWDWVLYGFSWTIESYQVSVSSVFCHASSCQCPDEFELFSFYFF